MQPARTGFPNRPLHHWDGLCAGTVTCEWRFLLVAAVGWTETSACVGFPKDRIAAWLAGASAALPTNRPVHSTGRPVYTIASTCAHLAHHGLQSSDHSTGPAASSTTHLEHRELP